MKIIISPAKKMNVDTDTLACRSTPVFLEQTEELLAWMRQLTFEQAKELWKCNDRIAEQNYRRFQEMNLNRNLTPAVIAYEGIQYQYMAPAVFGGSETDYIQEHLRILSGFYGVLKPFDGVVPYRLEMQAKASEEGDLYKFWGDRLYREVVYGGERAQEGGLNRKAGKHGSTDSATPICLILFCGWTTKPPPPPAGSHCALLPHRIHRRRVEHTCAHFWRYRSGVLPHIRWCHSPTVFRVECRQG